MCVYTVDYTQSKQRDTNIWIIGIQTMLQISFIVSLAGSDSSCIPPQSMVQSKCIGLD